MNISPETQQLLNRLIEALKEAAYAQNSTKSAGIDEEFYRCIDQILEALSLIRQLLIIDFQAEPNIQRLAVPSQPTCEESDHQWDTDVDKSYIARCRRCGAIMGD